MSKIQILTEFKNSLVSFLDELIEQFPEEGDLVVIRIFLNDQVPIADVMSTMISKLLPLKEMVKKRDDNFFLNNNVLFDKLNKEKVNHFKILWKSDRLDAEDRSVIWRWYDLFINLTEKYQKAA
jgi:hypothetical protein